MSNNLLIIPVEFKNKIEKKEQSVIKKLLTKYEEFYVEKDSIENFKEYIQKNSPKVVAFFKSNITEDSHFIRALKSLNQEIKIILVSPQISNLKVYINKEKELYDEVYQLLESSSAIEVSNCRIASLVVVASNEDKDILSQKISEKFINTYDEVLEKDIEFAQKNKCLVSIIMLTYNQLADTKLCVESLFKHTKDVNFELIFVDNGSTKDDTRIYLETLKKEHKNIKTIFNEENLGFACANNQGIEEAEGEYVLLLNNDVILTDGWLSRMLDIAESDEKIGVVAPCTNHASGRQVVTFGGTENDDEGIQQFAKNILLKHAGKRISVGRIIGFCMLIKREVLFKVGVLDEMFGPGGYEDYDYCMRVKREGYNIIIALDTFIFHIGGKGYSSNNMDYMSLRFKNIELLIDKWTRNMLEIMEKLPDGMK